MAKIWTAPVGKVVKGHVLDVARKPFERALRDLDSRLYVKWNPKKLRGHGCWEIRMRPALKDVTHVVEFEGMTIQYIDYFEVDIVSHVLDCAFLNYDQIRKLKSMDTYAQGNVKNYVDRLESREASAQAATKEKARQEMLYNMKHIRREMKDFQEMLRDGVNPALLMKEWK